ncbi:MAG: lipoprotein [Betaproteobacteria bacterium]|nr:lipoprotein [Betaproteobacteria bacterium]
MRVSPSIVVALSLTLAVLSACGQKGPLRSAEPAPPKSASAPHAPTASGTPHSTSPERK